MKTSNAINKYYKDNIFYSNRCSTDKFFILPDSSISIVGRFDEAIKFIEEYQLLDADLWKKFVNQFANTVPKADDADNGWRGEYWGKMMRGACFTYSYTKNPVLYRILTDTVTDMMATADEYGRISSYSREHEYNGWDVWSRKYVILGMQYFMEICEDKTLAKKIEKTMCAAADYILNTIGPESEKKTPITKTSNFWLGMNSSSILEPIVRLYNLTGYKRYLDFATYIVETGGIDGQSSIFELAYEDSINPSRYPVNKAYEMMSCFEGLIEYYRVTHIEKWKTASVNFARRICKSEISIIGSAGCTHELFDNSAVRQTNTLFNGAMQETCVTVTWMKFCLQILLLTGDPSFADEIEKSLYNAYLGSININHDKRNGDLPFDSYSPLLMNTRMRGIGGAKLFPDDGTFYGCCACIGSAGTGLIGKYAALLSNCGVAVNLYANEKIKFSTPSGRRVSIHIETLYPADGMVNITVDETNGEEYEIKLRIPSWSEKTSVSVCGATAEETAGTYFTAVRKWKKGDSIRLKFDLRCRAIYPLYDVTDQNAAYHVAFRRGPLVLAGDARLGDIEEVVNFKDYGDGEIPCEPSDKAEFANNYCFALRQSDGKTLYTVDYASAGMTYDEKSIMTAWFPTKKYWQTRIDGPIKIICPDTSKATGKIFSLAMLEDGRLGISETVGDTLRIEKFNDVYCYIKDGDRYFKVVGDDGCPAEPDNPALIWNVMATGNKGYITLSDKTEATLFKVERFIQDKYKIYTESGKELNGTNYRIERIGVTHKSYMPSYVFRIIAAE